MIGRGRTHARRRFPERAPFHDDGLRDGEHLRPWTAGLFREVLADGRTPWLELCGDRGERQRQALAAVDRLLAEGVAPADPPG
ncbi:hypothetical protein OG871_24345 [Kitasatospora sp. NBC_00374]|uniref:hypothetical protein n=1 Tax=Kitasatospora sp. NBC_00374 TaxID=2975964 RepID=UPI003246E1C0